MEEKPNRSKKHIIERLKRLFDLDLTITKEKIPVFLPFLLFIAFLVILYIANKYYSEKSYLKESNLKKELKELRAESLTIKAELVNKTKQTEVIEKAKELGLEELETPPKKIIINKDEY